MAVESGEESCKDSFGGCMLSLGRHYSLLMQNARFSACLSQCGGGGLAIYPFENGQAGPHPEGFSEPTGIQLQMSDIVFNSSGTSNLGGSFSIYGEGLPSTNVTMQMDSCSFVNSFASEDQFTEILNSTQSLSDAVSSAVSRAGGAIAITIGATTIFQMNISQSLFQGCSAQNSGGAIKITATPSTYEEDIQSTLHLHNNRFTSCTAGAAGGAVSLEVSNMNITLHSKLTEFVNCEATGPESNGGAIHSSGLIGQAATLVIDQSNFTGCASEGSGGAIYAALSECSGSSTCDPSSSYSVADSLFSNNQALSGASAIEFGADLMQLEIADTDFVVAGSNCQENCSSIRVQSRSSEYDERVQLHLSRSYLDHLTLAAMAFSGEDPLNGAVKLMMDPYCAIDLVGAEAILLNVTSDLDSTLLRLSRAEHQQSSDVYACPYPSNLGVVCEQGFDCNVKPYPECSPNEGGSSSKATSIVVIIVVVAGAVTMVVIVTLLAVLKYWHGRRRRAYRACLGSQTTQGSSETGRTNSWNTSSRPLLEAGSREDQSSSMLGGFLGRWMRGGLISNHHELIPIEASEGFAAGTSSKSDDESAEYTMAPPMDRTIEIWKHELAFFEREAPKTLQVIQEDEMQLVKELGNGSMKRVLLASWRNMQVAVAMLYKRSIPRNIMNEDQNELRLLLREISMLCTLSHPNVVRLYGVTAGHPGFVMEFVKLGSLKKMRMRYPEQFTKPFIRDVLIGVINALVYLHSKNIVHFDIKADNVLMEVCGAKPLVKLADLGLSKVIDRELQSTHQSGAARGTLPWIAPELFSHSPGSISKLMHIEKVDVYSFAILMWEVMTGDTPYVGLNEPVIINDVVKGRLRPDVGQHCDSELIPLMQKCWAGDPIDRPSAEEIRDELHNGHSERVGSDQADGPSKGML